MLIFREEIGRVVTEAFATMPSRPLLDQVLHLFGAMIALHERDRGLARVFVRELPFVEDRRHGVAEMMASMLGGIALHLSKRRRLRGELRADVPATRLANSLFSLYFCQLQRWLGGDPISSRAARPRSASRAQIAARGLRNFFKSAVEQKIQSHRSPVGPVAAGATVEEVADGSTHRARVSKGAVQAARGLGRRRQGHRRRVASCFRGRREHAGADFRSSARGARSLPDAGSRDWRADQLQPHDSALARRPRTASRMPAENRGVHRRAHGPDARLYECHVRGLRGSRRRMGYQRQRTRRREPCRVSEAPRAQGSLAHAHYHSSHDRQGQGRRARAPATKSRCTRLPTPRTASSCVARESSRRWRRSPTR